jgi:hypothetical protein
MLFQAETARGTLDGIAKASDEAVLSALKGEKELVDKAESIGFEYIMAEVCMRYPGSIWRCSFFILEPTSQG